MENNFDDLQYVSRVLQGDQKAFEKLINKYQLLIKKLAYNYLHHQEDILDASQDIFMEIYRSLPKFDLSKRFLPWMYSIALNTLKKKYHKNIRIMKTNDSAIDAKRLDIYEEIAHSDHKDLEIQIKSAIDKLPNTLKEVIILYYFENLKVSEICDILELSSENIKSRLFRARKKLKLILKDIQLF